jgi:hypothetical protein
MLYGHYVFYVDLRELPKHNEFGRTLRLEITVYKTSWIVIQEEYHH